MVLKRIETTNLRTEPNIRLDADHALHQSAVSEPLPICHVFTVGQGERVDSEPEVMYRYCEIGDVDRLGLTAPRTVDPNFPEVDPELRKQEDRIRRKVQQRKAMTLDRWCVLVPKTRPYLKKFAIISGNESTYFTTDFFVLEPGSVLLKACNGAIEDASCLLFLLLKGPLNALLTSISRWGKSYPTLHPDDLANAVIDAAEIPDLVTLDRVEEAVTMRRVVTQIVEGRRQLQRLTV